MVTKMNNDRCKSWLEIEEENDNAEPEIEATKRGTKETNSAENSSICKRMKYHNNSESDKSDNVNSKHPVRKPLELETDINILQRRQKQIDYGKNTVGYHNYTKQVDVDQRTKDHPQTPDKYVKYSRRSWDTLIKIWRKKLHEYDSSKSSKRDNNDSDEDLTA